MVAVSVRTTASPTTSMSVMPSTRASRFTVPPRDREHRTRALQRLVRWVRSPPMAATTCAASVSGDELVEAVGLDHLHLDPVPDHGAETDEAGTRPFG